MAKITKEEFEKSYNNHLPNTFTKFVFKYFSTNTAQKDLGVKKSVQYTLIGLFLGGFIGTIIGLPRIFIGTFTITYSIILVLIGIMMGTAVIMNNGRIKKICKDLGIEKWEYNNLISEFYPEL